MTFFPYENYKLSTRLTSEEVKQRLQNVIEQKKLRFTFFVNSSLKPYEGQITNESFRMSRIIWYRNSFRPIILGTLMEEIDRTEIHIRMRMSIGVIIFTILWLVPIGVIALLSILSYTFNGTNGQLALTVVLLFLFGYLLITGAFKYESIKSKKFISELLDGYIKKGIR